MCRKVSEVSGMQIREKGIDLHIKIHTSNKYMFHIPPLLKGHSQYSLKIDRMFIDHYRLLKIYNILL